MASKQDEAAVVEYLSMDEVAAAPDVEYDTVVAWAGKPIRIGSLTAADLIEWSEASEGEAKRTAGVRLIVRSMVDKDGNRIANDTHIGVFAKKSHKITETIVRAILKLNGMDVKADAAAKKD